jgi:hypothetical protein
LPVVVSDVVNVFDEATVVVLPVGVVINEAELTTSVKFQVPVSP